MAAFGKKPGSTNTTPAAAPAAGRPASGARPASGVRTAFASQFASTQQKNQRINLTDNDATGMYRLRVDTIGAKLSENPARKNEQMLFVKFTVMEYQPDREGLPAISAGEERSWARPLSGTRVDYSLSEFRSFLVAMAGLAVNSAIPVEAFSEDQPLGFIAQIADALTLGEEYPHDFIDEHGNGQVAQFLADWNARAVWPMSQEINVKVYKKEVQKGNHAGKVFTEIMVSPVERKSYSDYLAVYEENGGSVLLAAEEGA